MREDDGRGIGDSVREQVWLGEKSKLLGRHGAERVGSSGCSAECNVA